MRKGFRRGVGGFRRRRTRVSWWAPRTSVDFPGNQISCWADEPSVLNPTAVGGDTTFWPILWEGRQGLAPVAGDNSELQAHPWPQGYLVRAIRGEILLSMGAPNQPHPGLFGVQVELGVVKHGFLGDAAIIPTSPSPNDVTLDDWLWRKTIFLSTLNQEVLAGGSAGGANISLSRAAGCTDSCDYTGHIDASGILLGSVHSGPEFFGIPSAEVVPCRIKSRRRMRPEQGLTLVCRVVSGADEGTDVGDLFVLPRLRAVVSRPA